MFLKSRPYFKLDALNDLYHEVYNTHLQTEYIPEWALRVKNKNKRRSEASLVYDSNWLVTKSRH